MGWMYTFTAFLLVRRVGKLACEGIALSNFGKDQTVYFKRRGRLLRRGAWNFKSGNFACDKILYSDDDSGTFAVS